MIRWLKAARAELIRDFTLTLRYPLELLTGLFVLYLPVSYTHLRAHET